MTFKYSNFRALKSVNPKSSGGSAPWTPGRALPCTPPGALRRAPGPHPKSARAYALAMCAPRTCLPPPKKIGSRLRARYVRSAHMFAPKKIGPQQFKKIGSRFALAMCATRTCLPPHNQSLPLLAPPLFKSWCRHWPHKQCSSSYDLPNNMFVWSSWMMRMLKHVQNALNIPYGTKSATFFLTPWTRKCMIWQWSHYSYAKINHSICA